MGAKSLYGQDAVGVSKGEVALLVSNDTGLMYTYNGSHTFNVYADTAKGWYPTNCWSVSSPMQLQDAVNAAYERDEMAYSGDLELGQGPCEP